MKHYHSRSMKLVNSMLVMALMAMHVTPFVFAEESPNKRKASKSKKPSFAKASKGKPIKVFILAGQSNMQPRVWYTQLANGLKDSPETKYLHDKLFHEDGTIRTTENIYLPQLKDYENWLSKELQEKLGKKKDTVKAGPKLLASPDWYRWHRPPASGPELTFAVTMYEDLDQPILIIKAAWGGKSLYEDFRPPIGKEWEPPKTSPDHPDNKLPPHPIPKTFSLPKDFQKPKGSKNMQICQGHPTEKMHGISPLYVNFPYGKTKHGDLTDIPLKKGDLIIGLNGEALVGDPITQWRDMWFTRAREGDWLLDITVFRDGKIETVTVDVAESIPGGRDALPEYLTQREVDREKLLKEGGEHYHMLIDRVKTVLADIDKYHPAYDPEVGYEVGGFVWFQGYNDYIASVTYPNRNRPGGYDQYSWLLTHFIRSLRKDLELPKLPVVVGVFGQVPEDHPFAQAQTQAAGYDEFKGNVIAVQTRPFVDHRIPELKAKLKSIKKYKGDDPNHPFAKAQARAKALGKIKGRTERRIAEAIAYLGPEDGAYLGYNECEAGFHYYGSPKFFMRSGEAFAKGLIGIMEENE